MPDPVVPATRACGPSRARSIATRPSAVVPSAAIGAGSSPAAREPAAMAIGSSIGAGPCCSANRPTVTATGARPDDTGSSGSTRPASTRATAVAVSSVRPATCTGTGWPSADASDHHRPTPSDPTSRMLRHIAGVDPSGPTTASTAALGALPRYRRSGPVRWLSASARSVTTTTWRPAPSSRAPSTATRRSVSSAATTRGPSGPAACGNQRHQSHAVGSSATTTSWTSAGPLQTTSLHDERAGDRDSMGTGERQGGARAEDDRHRHVVEPARGRGDGRQLRCERLGRAPVELDVELDRAAPERHPVQVRMTAAAAPQIAAQRSRRLDRGRHVGCRRVVVASPGESLRLDRGAERHDVRLPRDAAGAPVAPCAQRRDEPEHPPTRTGRRQRRRGTAPSP